AARAFARAWGALAAGEPPDTVMRAELAAAVVATRLGAIDAEFLRSEHLPPGQVDDVLRRGWAAATATLSRVVDAIGDRPSTTEWTPYPALLATVATAADAADENAIAPGLRNYAARAQHATAPAFVARLAEQPRAGPTRPDTPRLMLVPAETHAEHCWAVAVTAALVAPAYDADPARVFLAGLAHHLANAWLPDAGDAADVALSGALDRLATTLRERALAQLSPELRDTVEDALEIPPDTRSPEAHAFHAADALDRVFEMEWFARAAAFTLDTALGEGVGAFDILHPGPNQDVERTALRAAGLYP
ncbi:MAG TPA: HD domain-containing protein, partial [Gemmatirosa sp.]